MNVIMSELPIQLDLVAYSALRVCVISVGMGLIVVLLLPYISGIPSLLAVIGVGVAIWAVSSTLLGIIDLRRIWSFLSFS